MALVHLAGPFIFPLRYEPDGHVLLRGSIVVRAGGVDASGGSARVPLRLEPVDGGKPIEANAVGLLSGLSPSMLTAEILTPPGRYRILSANWPERRLLFDIPSIPGSPVRSYCRHRTASPSWFDILGIVSARGDSLASASVFSAHACCRVDFPRSTKGGKGNVGALGFVQALTRPLAVRLSRSGIVIKPGECLVVNPEEMLAISERASFPLHFRHLVVDRRFLDQFRGASGLAALKTAWGFEAAPRPISPLLASSILHLEEAMRRPTDPGSELYVTACLNQFLLALLREFPNQIERAWRRRVLTSVPDERLARAVRYLETRFAHPYDRDALARHACCSRQLLQRLFQRHFRMDPRAYLMRIRVERAKSILASGERTLAAVAKAVGYADVRNFRRVFGRFANAPGLATRPGRSAGRP